MNQRTQKPSDVYVLSSLSGNTEAPDALRGIPLCITCVSLSELKPAMLSSFLPPHCASAHSAVSRLVII